MDRLSAMRAFVQVVEAGSFARAAERLGVSVSACSRQVADLEAHLDARLLNRTTRSLSLTEAGAAYLERCAQLLADLEDAEAAAHAGRVRARGTLRVTCSINFGLRHLSPLIAPFQERHPDVQLDVSLSDRMVDLVEEGFDVALRIGEVRSTTLVARRLAQTCLVTCASPAYLRRRGTPVTPQQLAEHNCLTYEYMPSRGEWRFVDAAGAEHRVRVAGSVHSNNGDLLAAAAVQGIGICCEPDFIVAADLAAGRLRRVLEGYRAPSTPIHAVYASRRHLSAKVRAFVDFLAEAFASWEAPGAPANSGITRARPATRSSP
ncbi:MAG: LysR family transcriptional regulator [Burkholderiales bacterium]|nr:LysR family transcriptional regulator [Burkholderiales bacterium]